MWLSDRHFLVLATTAYLSCHVPNIVTETSTVFRFPTGLSYLWNALVKQSSALKHELWVSGDTARGIHSITILKIESRHDAKFLVTNDYTFGIVATRWFQYIEVNWVSVISRLYVHREAHKDHILATGFVLPNSAMMRSSNGNIFRVIGPLCRSPMNSPHKGQWHGALMLSLIFAWTNGWLNNRDAGHLRCHRAHHDVTVMGCGTNRHQTYQVTLVTTNSNY